MSWHIELKRGVTHISFDCYGTLIDWETGILEDALPRLTAAGAKQIDPTALLRSFVKHEGAIESGPFRSYREVLRETFSRIAGDFQVNADEEGCAAFAASLARWPPFPDTIAALARLGSRYRLLILSNVDDDLFERTARRLQTRFDGVITALQVRSYKPALGHFTAARERLGLTPDNWLHVAQSLYHDHVPAKSLGLRTVWVDRPTRLAGTGIAPPAEAKPDARRTSLSEVADLLTT